ncbi:hypothetical protein PTKIN_Ptkin10aG0194400 [Pterospermum kingtungense]
MAFEPLAWYCKPVANAAWAKLDDGAFGAYTPCAIDTMVISISHPVLLGLCCYRIWLIKKNSKVQSYMLGLLAGYCTIEPLLRLLMGISIFNLNGETGLAHYEIDGHSVKDILDSIKADKQETVVSMQGKSGLVSKAAKEVIGGNIQGRASSVNKFSVLCVEDVNVQLVHEITVDKISPDDKGKGVISSEDAGNCQQATSLIIEATAWCSVLIMVGLETKSYIREFRWYVRFAVVYVLVGDAVLLNLILPVKDLYSSYALYLSISTVLCQVGMLSII